MRISDTETLIKAYLHDMFWQTCLKADQKSYCSYTRLCGRAVSGFSLKMYFFCLHNLLQFGNACVHADENCSIL